MEIITWTRVERDGGESLRRGAVWSPAPSAPGRLTHWVIRLPDDPGQNVDVLSWADLALVVTVTKRHRSEGGRGRYFDPGERYEDDVATALAGRGEWVRPGWLTRADCAPEFAREVFGGAEIGVLSRLAHSRFGLHVVEVVAREAGERPSFEQVRGAVELSLRQQTWMNALRQYLQLLAGAATLEGVDIEGAETPLVQ